MLPGKWTVLIVNDEPTIREVLARHLVGKGYSVVEAANGREALECISTQEFEVALLDISMPGMSGMEVLKRLHSDHPATAIVMATGVGDVHTSVEAMKAGASDYVLKPFDLEDVSHRVEQAHAQKYLELQVNAHLEQVEARLARREDDLRALTAHPIQGILK